MHHVQITGRLVQTQLLQSLQQLRNMITSPPRWRWLLVGYYINNKYISLPTLKALNYITSFEQPPWA